MHSTETKQDTTIVGRRKSVALTSDERKELKKFIKAFDTLTEAAESLGISRQRLDRLQLVGSGSPESITIIREKLNTAA